MDTQTNTVLYGRESSSNPRALNNQRNTLINKASQNNSNYTTLFETISGGNGMSKKLQKAISKENIAKIKFQKYWHNLSPKNKDKVWSYFELLLKFPCVNF